MKFVHLALGGVAALLMLRQSKSPPRATVRVVGDSLAVGIGAAYEKLDPSAETIAKVGTTTKYWLDADRWKDATKGAKLVFASLGTNDLNNGGNPIANLRKLDAIAEEQGAAVVWLIPPTRLWAGREAALSSAGLTSRSLTGCGVAPDGVHLTVAGYACAAGKAQLLTVRF